MNWYNSFKKNNGDYVTQEWSANEMFNYDIIHFCLIAVIGSLLAVLSSAVCLIARLWDYEENDKSPTFWGIFFALYFIVDYWREWPVTFILSIFESKSTLQIMATANLAILFTHILLFIFGDAIFYNEAIFSNSGVERKYTLIVYTLLCFAVSYIIALIII